MKDARDIFINAACGADRTDRGLSAGADTFVSDLIEAGYCFKLVGADTREQTMHFEPMPNPSEGLRINTRWLLIPLTHIELIAPTPKDTPDAGS